MKASREREARLAQARAFTLEDAAALRTLLTEAAQQALVDGQWGVCVSAVRAGIEIVKVLELESEVKRLGGIVEQLVAQREAAPFDYGGHDS